VVVRAPTPDAADTPVKVVKVTGEAVTVPKEEAADIPVKAT
jgi:hypothetical protein